MRVVARRPRASPGGRRFLAELPEGAAVFQLAAPGVRFLLHDRARRPTSPCSRPRRSMPPPSTPGTARCWPVPGWRTATPRRRRWCRASDGPAPPGQSLTARSIVWLDADAPVAPLSRDRRRCRPRPPCRCLVMADQIGARRHGRHRGARLRNGHAARSGRGRRCWASCRPMLALRLAAALIQAMRADSTAGNRSTKLDEARAGARAAALRDIAAFRRPALQPVMRRRPGSPAPARWRSSAAAQGFNLAAADPGQCPLAPVRAARGLCDLERLSLPRDRARRRLVEAGRPALHGRSTRRAAAPVVCWRASALAHRRPRDAGRDGPIDAARRRRSGPPATCSIPRCPSASQGRDIWRFPTFGARGDIRAPAGRPRPPRCWPAC